MSCTLLTALPDDILLEVASWMVKGLEGRGRNDDGDRGHAAGGRCGVSASRREGGDGEAHGGRNTNTGAADIRSLVAGALTCRRMWELWRPTVEAARCLAEEAVMRKLADCWAERSKEVAGLSGEREITDMDGSGINVIDLTGVGLEDGEAILLAELRTNSKVPGLAGWLKGEISGMGNNTGSMSCTPLALDLTRNGIGLRGAIALVERAVEDRESESGGWGRAQGCRGSKVRGGKRELVEPSGLEECGRVDALFARLAEITAADSPLEDGDGESEELAKRDKGRSAGVCSLVGGREMKKICSLQASAQQSSITACTGHGWWAGNFCGDALLACASVLLWRGVGGGDGLLDWLTEIRMGGASGNAGLVALAHVIAAPQASGTLLPSCRHIQLEPHAFKPWAIEALGRSLRRRTEHLSIPCPALEAVTVIRWAIPMRTARSATISRFQACFNNVHWRDLCFLRGCLREGAGGDVASVALAGNRFGDDGAAEFGSLCSKLGRLIRIDLSSNMIADRGLAAMLERGMGALKHTVELDLSQNHLMSDSAAALGEALTSGRLPRLKILKLANNRICETGLALLADAIDQGKGPPQEHKASAPNGGSSYIPCVMEDAAPREKHGTTEHQQQSSDDCVALEQLDVRDNHFDPGGGRIRPPDGSIKRLISVCSRRNVRLWYKR